MATQKPSDFVEVQLTAAGAAVAPVSIANGHFHYDFAVGKPVRVLTSEWRILLSRVRSGGIVLLEIAPDAEANAGSTAPISVAAPVKSPVAPPAAATPAAAPKAAAAPAAPSEKKQQDEARLTALQAEEQQLKATITEEE